jgi:hypothetical protein
MTKGAFGGGGSMDGCGQPAAMSDRTDWVLSAHLLSEHGCPRTLVHFLPGVLPRELEAPRPTEHPSLLDS